MVFEMVGLTGSSISKHPQLLWGVDGAHIQKHKSYVAASYCSGIEDFDSDVPLGLTVYLRHHDCFSGLILLCASIVSRLNRNTYKPIVSDSTKL